MAVLGQSYAEPVALRPQYCCFKIGSPLTLLVAAQFLSRLMHDSNNDNRDKHLPIHCAGFWRNEYGLASDRFVSHHGYAPATLVSSPAPPGMSTGAC